LVSYASYEKYLQLVYIFQIGIKKCNIFQLVSKCEFEFQYVIYFQLVFFKKKLFAYLFIFNWYHDELNWYIFLIGIVLFPLRIAKRGWCHIVILRQDRNNNAKFDLRLGFLWISLFILGKVWVYLRDFLCFQCPGNKTLNLLSFSWRISYF